MKLETSSTKRSRELEYLLTEAVVLLREQGEMMGAPPPPAGLEAPAPQTPPPPPVSPDGQQQPPEFTVDDLIDRLNVIRGGKSFDNPEIYKAISNFFNVIPLVEREVLDRTLTGISKAVINVGEEGVPQAPPGGAQQQMQPQAPSAPPLPANPPPGAPGGAPIAPV